MAKLLYTYVNPCNKRHLEKACDILLDDGIIAYPSDVNWAVGCHPKSKKAMNKLLQIKTTHPKDQPFSLLCNSIAMISKVAYYENFSYRLLKKMVPGAYTILLDKHRLLSRKIDDKRRVIGVRVPNSPLLLELMEHLDSPLLTSSLTDAKGFPFESSEKTIHFGYQVEELYGHKLDLILDLGEELIPSQTTIVDLRESPPIVIREGAGDIKIFQ